MKLFEPGSFEIVPHDGMRRIIGTRLLQAKQTIPHFYLSVDCALDNLLEARASLNEHAPPDKDGNPAWKLSVNDFVIKALGLALQAGSRCQCHLDREALLKHACRCRRRGGGRGRTVHAGDPQGRPEAAEPDIAGNEGLAGKARKRRLVPQEYQGGTTAVSNLGMFGIKSFDAVINPPHATILAVGAGEKRAVVIGEEIKIRTQMTGTLSCDHRAVDGGPGRQLPQAFKALVEEPLDGGLNDDRKGGGVLALVPWPTPHSTSSSSGPGPAAMSPPSGLPQLGLKTAVVVAEHRRHLPQLGLHPDQALLRSAEVYQ